MISQLLFTVYLCLANLGGVRANDWVHEDVFKYDHRRAAAYSAPDWHFMKVESCYPTAAFYADGAQHRPGAAQCPPDSNTNRAHDFPTYYRVRRCDYNGYQEYHIMYSLYFPWDISHDNDWEWAVVKWKRSTRNTSMFYRSSIVLAHHQDRQEFQWGDYSGVSPSDRNWRNNAENPVIFVQQNAHGLYDRYHFNGQAQGKWYWSSDWLIDGAGFPVRDWGAANSPPNAFEAGGWRDVCWHV